MAKIEMKADLSEELKVVRALISKHGNTILTRELLEEIEAEQQKAGAR